MRNGALVRREIWTVERGADDPPWDLYTLGYARAIGTMRERQPDDPTSWSYQAALHGTYQVPADPLWNGCQHGSWFFLPWHRMYIWYFEQIVRSAVAESGGPDDWALPYWNYTDGPAGSAVLPPAFRVETLPDGGPNPLFVPDGNRQPAVNAGAALPSIVTSTAQALRSTSFSPGFGGLPRGPVHFANPHGLLESQPHDNIHVVVGGDVTRVGCNEGWTDPNCAALEHRPPLGQVAGSGGGTRQPDPPRLDRGGVLVLRRRRRGAEQDLRRGGRTRGARLFLRRHGPGAIAAARGQGRGGVGRRRAPAATGGWPGDRDGRRDRPRHGSRERLPQPTLGRRPTHRRRPTRRPRASTCTSMMWSRTALRAWSGR
jgi:hypothetical protein